jgi:hypothetical protein
MTPTSPALWNRVTLDLRSDEILSQIMDRGDLADWRWLYRRAAADPELRRRMGTIAVTVPLTLPRFWLAALAALGERVDLGVAVPDYAASGCP